MANYLTTDTELTSIADAIRAKGDTEADLTYPAGFVSAINAIPTGGSQEVAAEVYADNTGNKVSINMSGQGGSYYESWTSLDISGKGPLGTYLENNGSLAYGMIADEDGYVLWKGSLYYVGNGNTAYYIGGNMMTTYTMEEIEEPDPNDPEATTYYTQYSVGVQINPTSCIYIYFSDTSWVPEPVPPTPPTPAEGNLMSFYIEDSNGTTLYNNSSMYVEYEASAFTIENCNLIRQLVDGETIYVSFETDSGIEVDGASCSLNQSTGTDNFSGDGYQGSVDFSLNFYNVSGSTYDIGLHLNLE